MTTPLKVNFTSEEATSVVREVPPSGEYVVNIVEGEIKSVKPGRKNVGRPFWQLQLVVQDGAFSGSRFYASVMLFDGALYSFAQLMRALGYDVNDGDFEVPSLEDIIGKTVNVKGFKRPPTTLDDGTNLPERFEIKGYKTSNKQGAAKAATSSILP